MSSIFWDSNLFIYLFEQNPKFMADVVRLRNRMVERGDNLFTSALTVGEVLAKPYAMGDLALAERYKAFFSGNAIHVLPFDMMAAEQFAAIRIDRTLSRPDAIQLACAAAGHIDLFITNDERLHGKTIRGIKFVTSLERVPV